MLARVARRPRKVRRWSTVVEINSRGPYVTTPITPPMKLSIVVPAFNESATITGVLTSLLDLEFPCDLEIVVIDDGSTDETGALIEKFSDERFFAVHFEKNRGKGAAILHGLSVVTGTHLLIFDADDEYDPADTVRLVSPLMSGRAEVVYGSRMLGFGTLHPTLLHRVGNHLMTFYANVLFNTAISDLHTCLKLIPVPLMRDLRLTERGFALDTEISAELLRKGFRPFEVPVSYVGRSVEDGKKIRFSDAVRCLYVLTKVRFRPITSYGSRDRSLVPAVRSE